MIDIESLLADLEQNLNNILSTKIYNTPLANQGNYKFTLLPDGGEYEDGYKTRGVNGVNYQIFGIGSIIDSSITPISGIQVANQTLDITVAVRLEQSKGVDDSSLFLPVRNTIAEYAANFHTMTHTASGKTFSVNYTLSQPSPSSIEIRPEIGRSILYNFQVYYSFIQNGINSTDVVIEIENEKVLAQNITIVKVPVQDASCFSNSAGKALNITNSTAFEISFNTPAITGSKFMNYLTGYLIFNTEAEYTVNISVGDKKSSRIMQFGQVTLSAQGIENAGYSVTLVDAFTG